MEVKGSSGCIEPQGVVESEGDISNNETESGNKRKENADVFEKVGISCDGLVGIKWGCMNSIKSV